MKVVAAATLFTLLALPAAAATFRFSDATPGSGIDYVNVCGAAPDKKLWLNESMGAGAAWLDYDRDGKLDLYVVNGSAWDRKPGQGEPNRLYRGDGRGKFTDVTAASATGHRGWGYGVAVGDYDNDGDADIYVTNLGPNVLYRNRGDGTFEDVTAKAGVAGDNVWSTSAAFFDMDNDGDLDLYVGRYMVCSPQSVPARGSKEALAKNCIYRGIEVFCGPLREVALQDTLYRNEGHGTFKDVTREAGIWLDKPLYALGVVTTDFDNDGDQDVYVANDSVRNLLWQNDGKGRFRDVGVEKLVAFNVDGLPQAGMGTDAADFDADGFIDLVVTNFSEDINTIYRNQGGRYFMDDSARLGMNVTQNQLSWGVAFHDFDLDADLDLFIANGHVYPQVDGYSIGTEYRQKNHLFENRKDRFVQVGTESGPGLAPARSFRGAAFADYDGDGDVDVFVTALDEAGLLMRNDSPRADRHWIEVRLVGTRSNRDGIGARVTATWGTNRRVRERRGGGSYLSAGDPRLHFGLGPAVKVDTLEVRWPSGQRDVLRDVAVDREITVREGAGAGAR
jgi:hypothetical protein